MLILSPWLWRDNDDAGDGTWSSPPRCRGAIDLTSTARIAEARPGQPRGWGLFLCDEIPPGLADTGGVILSVEDLRDARPDGKLLDIWESVLGYRPIGESLADLLWDQLTAGADPANLERNGMLVPGIEGQLQLWLGGLIREERFVFGEHSHTEQMRALLRRQLNQVREAALEGRLISPLTGQPDIEYHLRIADALVEKYAGTSPTEKADLFAYLKPVAWDVAEQPKPHATTISDNFDTGGGPGSQLTWTQILGTWVNSSQRLDVIANAINGVIRAESDLSSADHEAHCDVVVVQNLSSRFGGACVRFASGATTYYMTRVDGRGAGAVCQLYKVVAGGTPQPLGSGTTVNTSGLPKVLKCRANGSSMTTSWDGIDQETVTDTAIDGTTVGGLRTGVYCLTGSATHWQFDNFSASDLTTAAVTYPQLERGIRGLNRGLYLGMK